MLDSEGEDTNGLAAAYDAYADRLYDYAASLLPANEVDRAGAVVGSALRKAADMAEPSDAARLRPFLYATVREECAAFGPTPQGRRARLDDGPPEQRILSAITLLTADEREVFDLGLRHQLPLNEVAEVSGRSINATLALLLEVRVLLAKAVGAPVQGDALLAAMPLASAPELLREEVLEGGSRRPRTRWILVAAVLVAGGFAVAQLRPGEDPASRDVAPHTPTVSTTYTERSTTLAPTTSSPIAPTPSPSASPTAAASAVPTPTPTPVASTSNPAPAPTKKPGKGPTKRPTKPPRPKP